MPLATQSASSAVSPTAISSRNVRCLIVGEDLDFGLGSFALAVDENMTVDQLTQHVLRHIPSDSQERIGSELQLFKGFDLYTGTSATTTTTTPTKPKSKRRASLASASPIDELLHSITPEKTANKYFQRKYAMRKRASLGEYLPRGRKCESSRIDVLVSVPKFQLSEDVANMETQDESEPETEIDFGFDDTSEVASIASTTDTRQLSSPLKKRKRDPVVEKAMMKGEMCVPTKWQRASCGRMFRPARVVCDALVSGAFNSSGSTT